MSRRPGNLARRLAYGGSFPFVGSVNSKSRPSPILSITLVIMGAVLIIGYCYSGSGRHISEREALSKSGGKYTYSLHKAYFVVCVIYIMRLRGLKTNIKRRCSYLAEFRSSTWWIKYFCQIGLEDNESAAKKFEQAIQAGLPDFPPQVIPITPLVEKITPYKNGYDRGSHISIN